MVKQRKRKKRRKRIFSKKLKKTKTTKTTTIAGRSFPVFTEFNFRFSPYFTPSPFFNFIHSFLLFPNKQTNTTNKQCPLQYVVANQICLFAKITSSLLLSIIIVIITEYTIITPPYHYTFLFLSFKARVLG